MVKLVDLRRGSYAAAGKAEKYELALKSFRAEAAFYEQCAPMLEQVPTTCQGQLYYHMFTSINGTITNDTSASNNI